MINIMNIFTMYQSLLYFYLWIKLIKLMEKMRKFEINFKKT